MAITTLVLARAKLFAALDVPVVNDPTYIAKVFDYEPPPQEHGRPGIVTIFATGVTPNEWQFSIRIYQHVDTGQEDGQRNIDVVILNVEAAMKTSGVGNIGPSQWSIGFADGVGGLVAQSDVIIVREDF